MLGEHPYFSPALRRAAIWRSSTAGSLWEPAAHTSSEKLGLILKTSAAAARASSSRPSLTISESQDKLGRQNIGVTGEQFLQGGNRLLIPPAQAIGMA